MSLCGCCGRLFMAGEAIGSDDEDDENPEEEVRAMRQALIPNKPSASEIEEHRKCHTPYRSWCPWCVMGRGLGEQRGWHAGREHTIPRVGIDYWYITSKGVEKREELDYKADGEGEAKLLGSENVWCGSRMHHRTVP